MKNEETNSSGHSRCSGVPDSVSCDLAESYKDCSQDQSANTRLSAALPSRAQGSAALPRLSAAVRDAYSPQGNVKKEQGDGSLHCPAKQKYE